MRDIKAREEMDVTKPKDPDDLSGPMLQPVPELVTGAATNLLRNRRKAKINDPNMNQTKSGGFFNPRSETHQSKTNLDSDDGLDDMNLFKEFNSVT